LQEGIFAGGRSMTKPAAPASIRRRQRGALIMLVIAGTPNYLGRLTLSIANPLIRNELGLSIADMGLLLSAFVWAYAFAQLPGVRWWTGLDRTGCWWRAWVSGRSYKRRLDRRLADAAWLFPH
jgi:hypothetical protein